MSGIRWHLESVLGSLTTLDIKPVCTHTHTHTHTNTLRHCQTHTLHNWNEVTPLDAMWLVSDFWQMTSFSVSWQLKYPEQSCLRVCTCIYAWINVCGHKKETIWTISIASVNLFLPYTNFLLKYKLSGTQIAFLDFRV